MHRISIVFILATILLLFCGCDSISALKKEAKEERKILGYVKGFNPRIKEIERALKEEGFNPGPDDGIMDKQTRKAIRNFQKANRLRENGFIDTKTKARLDSLIIQKAKEKRESLGVKEIKNRLGSALWIKKIQRALKRAGFDPGPANGTIGEKTKKAIMSFQKSKGLPVNGIIDPKTWGELSKYFPKD